MKLVVYTVEGEKFFPLIDSVDGVEWIYPQSEDELIRELSDAEVFFGVPNRKVMEAGPNLKWIQSSAAGINFLMDLPDLVESDILLTNTRGAHAPSIAEHVFALLLALTRAIPQSVELQKHGVWHRSVDFYRMPKEITGMTMGILGYGQIGRMVAKRASGFDLKIRATDLFPAPGDAYVDEVMPVHRLPEMLAQTDILVIAAPYTQETHHLIDSAAIATMPANSYVIAISRGGVVDEDALAAALQSGHLAGAGIDVAETEPLPSDSPLWNAPNILITPHIAGASWQKERRCVEILVDNLGRYQRGETLVNICDKKAGY